jgi:TRAP-type C4-dicarboxylate transport system permease small subunit
MSVRGVSSFKETDMAFLKKLFFLFFRALENLATFFMVIMVLVVFFNVLQRNFLKSSLKWSDEISTLMMVWFGFLGIAIGILERIHISIEVFTMKFPKKAIDIITRAGYILIAIFGFLMVRYGIQIMSVTKNSTMPATQWPSSVLYVMLPLSGVLVIINSILVVFNLDKAVLKELTRGKEDKNHA